MIRQNLIQRIARLLLAAVLGLTTALAAGHKPPEPVNWSLKMEGPSQTIKPGGVFKVQLEARIEEGWHLYSTEQPSGGPKPTRIVVPPDQVFELGGTVESPSPLTAHDKNFDIETEFYEEAVTFTLPMRVSAGGTPGAHNLRVEVRFQSCNAELCLPPTTVKLVLPVEVGQSR